MTRARAYVPAEQAGSSFVASHHIHPFASRRSAPKDARLPRPVCCLLDPHLPFPHLSQVSCSPGSWDLRPMPLPWPGSASPFLMAFPFYPQLLSEQGFRQH